MEKEPGEQRAFKRHDAASFSLQPLYCYTPFQKSVLCRKSNKHFGYILSRFLDFWYEISTKIHVRFKNRSFVKNFFLDFLDFLDKS